MPPLYQLPNGLVMYPQDAIERLVQDIQHYLPAAVCTPEPCSSGPRAMLTINLGRSRDQVVREYSIYSSGTVESSVITYSKKKSWIAT
jgi:hypothetical protein